MKIADMAIIAVVGTIGIGVAAFYVFESGHDDLQKQINYFHYNNIEGGKRKTRKKENKKK